ncbi:MAG: T9SS type A sorting domain-containing protein [Flavobacteriales bacterium]
MKPFLYTVLGLFQAPLFAQPIFTAADFAEVPGYQVPLYVGNYYAPGPANSTFNLNRSNAVLGTPADGYNVPPGTTPYAGSFPGANYASRGLTDTTSFTYGLLNETGLYQYGNYSPTSHVILNNPELLLRLPMAYGDTWSDTWSGAGVNQGQNYSRSGTTTGTYNGVGTVQTPFGTYTDVARVQVEQNYFDVVDELLINYTSLNVYYFIQGFNRAIFTSSRLWVDIGFTGQEELLQQFATFADPGAVGIVEAADPFGLTVFPNPADAQVELTFATAPTVTMEVELLDAAGRVLQQHRLAPAATRHTLYVADLCTGTYLVRITDGEAQRVLPLMVQ